MAGRPTKYKIEYNEQAYKLCKILGTSDAGLAFYFDITETSLNYWKATYEKFGNAIQDGLEAHPEYIKENEERKAKRRGYKKSPHIREYNNEYLKNRIANEPKIRVRHNFSSLLRGRLKSKNGKATFKSVGYTIKELMEHLEKKFVEGMTWDNYGKVWHIDHIKPDSMFNYESVEDEEFKECWSLDNLQPLFAEDNLRKGNRYAG